MLRVLVQLDSSPHPSTFDRIVAIDGSADHILSYGNVVEDAVRDLVHGAIFTRGPKDLANTAIFIGGTDMAAGERLLAAVRADFLGPLRVSVMLDSNGSNTTAAAAVAKLERAAGGLDGRRAIVTAGTGPVGMRAAGLLAQAGAHVTVTSRRPDGCRRTVEAIQQRFGHTVRGVVMEDDSHAAAVLEGADLLLHAGVFGVRLVPHGAWARRSGLCAVADLNAVPPSGIEGIEPGDDGVEREGVVAFGALGVGQLKMKVHKACVRRLFERNDLVLDAEAIVEVARQLVTPSAAG